MIRRRDNPPQYSDYTSYKQILREDFRYCCAYCCCHERVFGALRNMTIDHFRPRRFKHLLAAYSNLYYCCGDCNTYKGDAWPSDHELAQGLRFIDVCADELSEHLAVADGELVPLSGAGRYTEACLRLNRRELLRHRRQIANKFHTLMEDLARLDAVRRRAAERGGGSVDLEIEAGLNAVRHNLIAQLRDLIFPAPLVT